MEKFGIGFVVFGVILFAVSIGLFINNRDRKKTRKDAVQAPKDLSEENKAPPRRDRLEKPPFGSRWMTEKVDALNLSRVRAALVEDGWDESRIQKAEKEYRRFLFLFGVSGEYICPWGGKGSDLDLFWHRHILDMKQYEADCLELFGMVFYHEPAVGKPLDKEEQGTQELYHRHFDPRPVSVSSSGKKKTVTPSDAAVTTYQDSNSWLPWAVYAPFLMDSDHNYEKLGVPQDQPLPAGNDAFVDQDDRASGHSVASSAAAVPLDGGTPHVSDAGGGHHGASHSACSSSCGGGGGGCGGGS